MKKNTRKLDIARAGYQNNTFEEECFKNPLRGECLCIAFIVRQQFYLFIYILFVIYMWYPHVLLYIPLNTVCDGKCSLSGCVEETTNECCHKECLGGCSSSNSDMSCYACKNYRVEETGQCVDTCVQGYYKVSAFLYCVLCDPGGKPKDMNIFVFLDFLDYISIPQI